MKRFLKNANSGIICIVEIIVGVLLLLDPHSFISYILIIAGAFIALSGIVSLIKYFTSSVEDGEASQGLLNSLVSLTIGAFLIIKNNIAFEALDLITIVFGIAILYTGYQKLQKAVDKIRRKQIFIVALISALVTIACSVLIIFVIGEKIIWVFMGVALIVEAVIDLADIIVGTITSKKKAENNDTAEAKAEETKPEEKAE